MLGSQEKFLEQKVNVKFFTVDPYTPCYRVSRPFPIWSIWQIWPLLGQKNMFFGGLVNWGNEIWIVFGWFQGFLGHQNDFWKFQKLSKILTQNSVKITGNCIVNSAAFWKIARKSPASNLESCLSSRASSCQQLHKSTSHSNTYLEVNKKVFLLDHRVVSFE